MAGIYKDQGKYEEALEIYEKALSIRLKKLGDDHPDVTATKNCIQAILEKLGKDHPNVATTYHNMAGIYKDQGNLKEALRMYENALWIRLETLGDDHPDVTATKNCLSALYRAIFRDTPNPTWIRVLQL